MQQYQYIPSPTGNKRFKFNTCWWDAGKCRIQRANCRKLSMHIFILKFKLYQLWQDKLYPLAVVKQHLLFYNMHIKSVWEQTNTKFFLNVRLTLQKLLCSEHYTFLYFSSLVSKPILSLIDYSARTTLKTISFYDDHKWHNLYTDDT